MLPSLNVGPPGFLVVWSRDAEPGHKGDRRDARRRGEGGRDGDVLDASRRS